MIRLNRVEKAATIGVIAVVILFSGLIIPHWFYSNLEYVPVACAHR